MSDNSTLARPTGMSYEDIDPEDIIFDMDLGFGPEVWFADGRMVSVCGPCLEHDGRFRRAAFTGAKALDLSAPNLCKTHYQAYRKDRDWDRPLHTTPGRPRVMEAHCALVGCGGDTVARGLCRKHYQKDYRAKRKEESNA